MILRRLPGERFSEVLPAWAGRTVALLAGGPSLTRDQFAAVREARESDHLRTIAINDSYLLAPWADVHYAADEKWHRWHTDGIEKPLLGLGAAEVRERWAFFRGQKATMRVQGWDPPETVHVLRNKADPLDGQLHVAAISRDPRFLFTGRHSGFQAINLATLAGATRILLLGYDARRGAAGELHWHGNHPVGPNGRTCVPEASYDAWRRALSAVETELLAMGVTVLNCSLTSAINAFPKVPLDEALRMAA